MPANPNLTQRYRQLLYSLKQEYGSPIVIYKLVSCTTDERTGTKTSIATPYKVRRAIVFPNTITRIDVKSSALTAVNREFSQGGFIDSGQRPFVIDRRDVPHLPDLTSDGWIVYDGRKFQVGKVDDLNGAGWQILGKELVGDVPDNLLLQPKAQSDIDLTDSAEGN